MGAVFPNYRRLLASYNHCRLRKKRCRIPRIPSCCPFERETRGPVLLQPEHHSDSDACCIALVVTDGATRWPESRRSLRTRAHPGCRRAIETLPSTREARPCGHRDLLQARWPTGESFEFLLATQSKRTAPDLVFIDQQVGDTVSTALPRTTTVSSSS